MAYKNEQLAGFIQLTCIEDGELKILGGAGFETFEELIKDWDSIPIDPKGEYLAERYDSTMSTLLFEKPINAETVIAKLGIFRDSDYAEGLEAK